MIRSLGDTADDAERWWRAYQLAENDQAGELRERADTGDEHARRQLASWLADRARTEEAIDVIRPLADAGDDLAELWLARWLADGDHLDELRQLVVAHWNLLSGWLARQHGMREARLAAELGDAKARRRLQMWLSPAANRSAALSRNRLRRCCSAGVYPLRCPYRMAPSYACNRQTSRPPSLRIQVG